MPFRDGTFTAVAMSIVFFFFDDPLGTLRRFADRPLRVAERAAGELMSLPVFPHLTESQVEFVCESLRDALGKMSADPELIDVP